MEENNKYYTPTTEEFHIGFEYLMTFETRGKQEIIPNTFEGLTNEEDIKYRLRHNCIKVKYLDKEDIESLGFKQTGEGIITAFENDTHHINFRIIDSIPDLCIYEKKNTFRVFSGKIKNKSELKKLFMQLEIN